MTRKATPKHNARQRAGLTLATPRRVRVEVDATPWELLSADDRRRAMRAPSAGTLAWSPLADEGAVVLRYRSSPVPVADGPAVMEHLRALGLATDAVRCVAALCWAHVAVVAYPDGHRVAFGLSEAPRGVAHAEAAGFPFARLEGGRVRPWEGCTHGHTDDEVRAAVVFVRPRTTAEGARA